MQEEVRIEVWIGTTDKDVRSFPRVIKNSIEDLGDKVSFTMLTRNNKTETIILYTDKVLFISIIE